jgi:hypothetical protein
LDCIFTLATLELSLVDLGSNGGGNSVDTHSFLVVLGTVGIKRVRSIHSKGRGSGGTGQLRKTSPGNLAGIGTLAAVKLAFIGSGSVGGRVIVDTVSLFPVANFRILIPDIKSSSRNGRCSRRTGKSTQTSSRSLDSVLGLAAF